jgi:hypothetical protein
VITQTDQETPVTTNQRRLVLAVTCFLSIVAVALVAILVVNGPARPVPVRPVLASSETTILATVLSIHTPDPQEPIDASRDSVDASKSWVVKAAVNRRLEGGDFVSDKTLTLLVQSPAQDLGVRRIGQTFEMRLQRSSKPVNFLVSPGHSVDPSELPATQHRRFSIVPFPF